MEYNKIIKKLKLLGNPKNVEGMARFGIRPKTKVLGVPVPETRKIAKEILKSVGRPTSHRLAQKLWDSKIHEARILAGYIADPKKFTKKEVEKWIKDFDSWDVVDQVCSACLDKTKFIPQIIFELAKRKPEFEKRTAFTLIACLSVHDKKAKNEFFLKFFPIIKKASTDERNFVKKAVNWALRQIGKRNMFLNKKAIKLAEEIKIINSKSAKWIANNAFLELKNEKIIKMIKGRNIK